jgi:putative hydrolase of the HAD superfamily
MVTSEEVGFKKPCPEIFQAALRRAEVAAAEAVFVGDSWESDIMPAGGMNMGAVWFNRYGLSCPDPKIAKEIRSFGELDFGAYF